MLTNGQYLNETDSDDLSAQKKTFQHSIKNRAHESISHLRSKLNSDPVVRRRRVRTRQKSPKYEEDSGNYSWAGRGYSEYSDQSYGAAVDKLRLMLQKHRPRSTSPKNVGFRKKSPVPDLGNTYSYTTTPDITSTPMRPLLRVNSPVRGEIPSSEEMLNLVQHQTTLSHQLQVENNQLQEELRSLQLKMREVVEENQSLHAELKSTVINELTAPLKLSNSDQTLKREIFGSVPAVNLPTSLSSQQDYTKWQHELQRLTVLHEAKSHRLESQLTLTKEDFDRQVKEIDDLKNKLRVLEGSARSTGENRICVKCAQSEAVLPSTSQKASIESVTKERDELMNQLASLRSIHEAVKRREEEFYEQVKVSVQMVEQSQFEQTQVYINNAQLRDELENSRSRIKEYADEMNKKISSERESARLENQTEREALNAKISELTEARVIACNQLDRVTREKMSIKADLEAAREQLASFDSEYGQATDGLKLGMSNVTLERNSALHELKRLKQSNKAAEDEWNAEKQRLKNEVESLKRRTNSSERDLVSSKEECIQLTNRVQELQRETHIAKLAKESIEKNRNDDLKAVTKRAEQREQELNTMLNTMETKHAQNSSELESIIASHQTLVNKLSLECRSIANKLEEVTLTYKSNNKKLKTQNEHLREKAGKTDIRLRELEQQNSQQRSLQEKMRDRLRELDKYAQGGSLQVIELLNKESVLLKDRQLLASEVEFLRKQFLDITNISAENVMYSSKRNDVEEILKNVQQGSIEKHTKDVINNEIINPT